jgi:hypothetical protein
VWVFFLLVATSFAQAAFPSLDCRNFGSAPACSSFSALLEKGDSVLLQAVSHPNEAVVCFRPGEDTFILISYPTPDEQSFSADPSITPERSPTTVTAMVYKNRKPDDLRHWKGHWERRSNQPKDAAVFTSAADQEGTARIDRAGLVISYAFATGDSNKIAYTLRVSKPALNGIETFAPMTSAGHERPSKTLTDQCFETRR